MLHVYSCIFHGEKAPGGPVSIVNWGIVLLWDPDTELRGKIVRKLSVIEMDEIANDFGYWTRFIRFYIMGEVNVNCLCKMLQRFLL